MSSMVVEDGAGKGCPIKMLRKSLALFLSMPSRAMWVEVGKHRVQNSGGLGPDRVTSC